MFRTIVLAAFAASAATFAAADGEARRPHVNAGIGNGAEVIDDGDIVGINSRVEETTPHDLDPGNSYDHNRINTWEPDFTPLTKGRYSD